MEEVTLILPCRKESVIAGGHPEISIESSIFREMIRYLREDVTVERGGFLLGSCSGAIDVTAFLPARHTREGPSFLEFTPLTWNAYDDEKSEKYPGLDLIGWVHTHPDLGVFLSNRDKAVNVFFDHLAVVYDPVRREIGFFYLKMSPPSMVPVAVVGKAVSI